jgi:hypothetical protein
MATVLAAPGGLPAALVVVAVRADYLGHLIADPWLKAAVDAGLFTVGPMSEAELRLAVTGPAAEAGLVVEPAVVEAVVAELRGEAQFLAGHLRAGLTVEQAAQRYSALLSPDLYHLLTREMGWPATQHQQWVTALLETDLLDER